MNASEWKTRFIAISRASAAGDDAPLEILCDQLAAMSEKCEAKPIPVQLPAKLHDYESAKEPKAKTPSLLEAEQIDAPITTDK